MENNKTQPTVQPVNQTPTQPTQQSAPQKAPYVPSKKEIKQEKKRLKKQKRMEKRDHNRNLKNFGLILLGGFLCIGLIVGSVAAVAGVIKLNKIEEMAGKNKNEIITEKYEDYTILRLVMAIVNGDITIDSLEGISDISPLPENFILDFLQSYGLTAEEYDEIAKIKFSDYEKDLLPLVLKSIDLNAVITKESVGEDIYGAICEYKDINDEAKSYNLYNIVNNQIYQEDNPLVVSNKGEPVEYLVNVISNLHFSTFLDTTGSLAFLADKTVGELTESFDQITIKELIGEDKCQDGILKTLGDATIKELTEDPDGIINGILLADVINTNNAGAILKNLLYENGDTTKPVSLGKLQEDGYLNSVIENMYLVDVFDIDRQEIEDEINDNNNGGSANKFNTMMKILCYKKCTTPGPLCDKLDPNSPRTLKDIQGDGNELKDIFTDGMTLGDVIAIDSSSNAVFIYLKDTKIANLGDAISNMPLSKLVSESALNSSAVLKGILTKTHDDGSGNMVEYTFSEISDCINAIKIGDVVDCSSSLLLSHIKDCSLDGDAILAAIKTTPLSDIILSTVDEKQCYTYRTVATPYTYTNEDKSSDPAYEKNPDAKPIYVAIVTKGASKTMNELGSMFQSFVVSDFIDLSSTDSVFLKALANAPLTEDGLQKALMEDLKVGDLIAEVCDEESYCRYRTIATPHTYSNEDKSSDPAYEKNPDVNLLMSVLQQSTESLENLGSVVSDLKLKDVISGCEDSFLSALADKPLSSITADDFKDIKIVEIFADDIFGAGNAHVASNISGVWKYLLFENSTEFANAKSAANDGYDYKYKSYTLDDMGQMMTNVTSNFKTATLQELKDDGMIDVEQSVLDKYILVSGSLVKVGTLTISQFMNAAGAML